MKRWPILFLALVTAASAGSQDAASWGLGGTLSTQPHVAYAGSGAFDIANFVYGSATTLGLDLKAAGESARAEASVEAAILTGASARLAWAVALSPFGRPDELLLPAPAVMPPYPATVVAARIRTLFVKLDFDWATLQAGRQVVNYGRGALWSPTDIFTELDLTGLSPVRRGSDALRFTVPLGLTGGFDLVAAPTASLEDGRYAARLGGLLWNLDGALIAARDGQGKGWIFGADLKTDLVVGLHGEAACEFPDAGGPGTLRAAGGADWSFGQLILAAEYYYNGGGASADPLFPGAHNISGSLTWTPTELLAISCTAIVDVGGGAGTASLLATLSVAQNATLKAYAQTGNGQAGYGVSYGFGGATWTAAGLVIEVKF
jgi:hypothetical protein